MSTNPNDWPYYAPEYWSDNNYPQYSTTDQLLKLIFEELQKIRKLLEEQQGKGGRG